MHVSLRHEVAESRAGRFGLVVLGVIVAAAVAAPLLSHYPPLQQSTSSFLPPSTHHLLGTNQVGQDIWSRLLYGARTSLTVGLSVGLLSTLLGLFFGISSALLGGLYERIVMRFVDALIVIPPVLVLILVAAYLGPGLPVLILLLAGLSWPSSARIIRAQALTLRDSGHINAARTFGAGWFYVARRHIVPDLGPILTVEFIYAVRRAVFMEAGIAFLGLGDPLLVSWGAMMRNAMSFSYLDVWLWWLIPTGLALSLTIVGLTFVSYAAETIIDPRLRGAEVA
jgi:peptide/nickel transport system permease protein